MRSSFSHHALSPEPLCVLWSVHHEPSGEEEVESVCICVSVCMLTNVLVFARVFGNVSLCVSACVVLLTENRLEGASQTR